MAYETLYARIDEAIKREMEQYSLENNISIREIVEEAVREWLGKHSAPKSPKPKL